MKDKVLKVYDEMPPWARGVLIIGSLGLVTYAVFAIIKSAKHKKELDEANQSAEAAVADLKRLHDRGINPSFPDSQFQIWVDGLFTAMDGPGTDETAIYNIFKNFKNDADVAKLVAAWGVRFFGNSTFLTDPLVSTINLLKGDKFGGSLNQWLTSELSGSEMTKLNNILASANITYRF